MSEPAWPVSAPTSPSRPPSRSGWIAVALVLVFALLVGSALLDRGDNDGTGSGDPRTADARGDSTEPGPQTDLATVLSAAEDSLQEFWSVQLPKLYSRTLTPLAGGFQAKTPQSASWACNGRAVTYADVKGNAFYCGGQGDDYIAYDAAFLLPLLQRRFGSLSPAAVLAHEMGHAIQRRAGVQGPSVVIELQADCFAGAWVAYARSTDSDAVSVTALDLDRALRGVLTLRDQPGTAGTNAMAHGLGFDRVNAFQTGFEDGTTACAAIARGHAVITELPFSTPAEAVTGGNLDFGSAVPLFVRLLNSFWTSGVSALAPAATFRPPPARPVQSPPLPPCAGDDTYEQTAVSSYCSVADFVSWGWQPLDRLHVAVGDMATGTALGESWSAAAQSAAGLPTDGRAASLQRVCFTGAWVSSIASGSDSSVQLSPGDLDEVLITIMTPLDPSQTRAAEGTSFERVAALRTGVLRGLASCRDS